MVVNRSKKMGILQKEIERATAQGDQKVGNEFSGAQRSLDQVALEQGDTFTIPTDFDVYEQKIGDNTVQYIFVEMEDGPSKGQAKKFYPSTFTKTRTAYNEDGTPNTGIGRISTAGTAAELFRSKPTINEGMNELKGKKLVVSSLKSVRTLRYGTTSLMNAQIPTIDLV